MAGADDLRLIDHHCHAVVQGNLDRAGFEGLIPNLRRRYEAGTWLEQENLEPYRALRPCPSCRGERLKAQSRAVKVKGRTISDYVNQPISEAVTAFDTLELSDRESLIASRILREIRDRLHFLNDVGVGYLTLGRSAATLSGGEGQRIRLATQIGSNLLGDEHYDQVAFFPTGAGAKFTGKSGVFDFDGGVFAALWATKTPAQFRSFIRYYLSDHRPLWAEFGL